MNNLNLEEEHDRYKKTLEHIVANALHQNAWYVEAARESLGKNHPLNGQHESEKKGTPDQCCFLCGNSMVTDKDELFCVIKETIVSEDNLCDEYN